MAELILKPTNITPDEFETIFHLVMNAREQSSSPQWEKLGIIASKVANRSTTGLRSYEQR